HDVGAELERPAQVRRGEGRIHHQRQVGIVGGGRYCGDVEHLEPRVAEDLGEHQLRVRPNGGGEGRRIARVDERRLDAEARQRVGQQVVGAAVQRSRRYDVIAGAGDGGDGKKAGRLAAGRGDGADASL